MPSAKLNLRHEMTQACRKLVRSAGKRGAPTREGTRFGPTDRMVRAARRYRSCQRPRSAARTHGCRINEHACSGVSVLRTSTCAIPSANVRHQQAPSCSAEDAIARDRSAAERSPCASVDLDPAGSPRQLATTCDTVARKTCAIPWREHGASLRTTATPGPGYSGYCWCCRPASHSSRRSAL